jgi:hypothetical protein
MPTTNNINYVGYDCGTCYFACAKSIPFKSIVVGRPIWLNMEGPCAKLCTVSFLKCGWPS